MLELTVKEFVNDECPYRGCEYNHQGFCENDSDDLLIKVIQIILNKKEIDDTSFYCEHCSIPPSTCQYCGQELKTYHERREHFGSIAYEGIQYCPNCD